MALVVLCHGSGIRHSNTCFCIIRSPLTKFARLAILSLVNRSGDDTEDDPHGYAPQPIGPLLPAQRSLPAPLFFASGPVVP